MKTTLTNLWPLFLGITLLLAGNGLQGTLLGVRGTMEGFSTFTIGIIMSCYSLGYMIGSITVQRLVVNVGHIRVFSAMASLASGAVLLHAVFPNPVLWMFIRMLSGFSFAALFVVTESWLNAAATATTRGKIMGIYLFLYYGAMGIGQFMLAIDSPSNFTLFIIVSVLISLALVPISLSKRPAPALPELHPMNLKRLFKVSPLGVMGVFISGLTVGTLFSIGPVFAAEIGYDSSRIAIFMVVIIFSGMIFQIPAGWLSDKFDRRYVLLGFAFMAAMIALISYISSHVDGLLLIFLGCLSALTLSIYSVAAAHTNDRLEVGEVVSASAGLILVNGMGSVAGPLVATAMMERGGPEMLFIFMALGLSLLGSFAVYRMTQRGAVPESEQFGHVTLPSRASTVMATLAETATIEAEEDKPQ